MGYVVNGSCYPDVVTAHAAHFAPAPWASNGTVETHYVPAEVLGRVSGSGWTRVLETYDAGGALVGSEYFDLPAVAFPACDYTEPFADGVAVGWLVASVLVVVYAIKVIRRGL